MQGRSKPFLGMKNVRGHKKF